MYFRKSSLALAILLCLSPIPEMNYANAQTYTVSGNSADNRGERLQALLNQASDGDIIRLEGDTRLIRGSGFFSFNKQVTIEGQGNRLHFEGYDLSLGKDVTFSNMNLSLKPSRGLDSIFTSIGSNSLEAVPTLIVTNGNKLTLDNVRTNVESEPTDTRPIILLGNGDTTKSNGGHDTLIVRNADLTETKLYSVIIADSKDSSASSSHNTTPVTIELGENVRLVEDLYLAGVDNDQSYSREINVTSASNSVTKILTGEATNVSVTLNNVKPSFSGILSLENVKNLTVTGNSQITLNKNLSVAENLVLADQAQINTVAGSGFDGSTPTALKLNNVQASDDSKINIGNTDINSLSIAGEIVGKLRINTDNQNSVILPENRVLEAEKDSYVVKSKAEVTQPVSENTTTGNNNTETPPATPTDSTPATTGEQTGSSDTTVTPPAADTSTTSNETTSPATTGNTATDSSNTDATSATAGEQTGSSDTTVTQPADTSATSNETTPPATTGDTATNSTNTDVAPAKPTDSTPATTGEQTGSSDTTATPPTDTAQTSDQAEASGSDTTTSTSAQPTDATAPTNGQTETSSASANHNKITITTAEQETQRTIAESRYATLVSNFALNSIRNRLEHSRSSDAYPYLTATVNGMIPTVSELGGLWVNSSSDRITQERYKFNNFGLQVGYDKSSTLGNGTARFGFALDVEKGKTNFAQFSETYKTQTYGMALYGAYETEDRHYLDVAVRMARASNELKSNASQAYHHNLYSASLAYSKGFELSSRWEIEPYTQLFYTHLSSTNYIKNGLNVTADEINSLVGSVGTKAEYQLNQTLNFYTKVAMHREFNATQDINIIRSATDRVQHNINHRGTWTTLGLGMKARLGNNTHLYLDADKLFGNGYKQSYQITLGLDWKF
ncbi:autotransporter domain-containing protein [Glaesserella parasuis]|uniref:autotransporter family protein n=1 Tax=Glaesserella parasuis TaxID=738 RepID=UPI001366536A|nr:autotransporter domain-containing protein [Glaesserella parasuis]MDG6472256.1 autotransporter domain-containing protein [Glaesserella parasuis]MDO9731014.1 autotransporter domain-containing protein [Glaesserella parasuis]MDO9764522.1 autotransporter domain-containing protein [Glaesserella parasuis]MWQ75807.1 autotransporter domain-containing protein [Glaesserella parasuis]